jgi:hypothetical protein
VRMWPRMTRDQLMHVFPDGRTVHIPSDGRPLSGYALALADLRTRGGTTSDLLLEQARSAGVDVADNGLPAQPAPPRFASIATFLGLAHDEEDEDAAAAAAPVATASADTAAPNLRTRAKAAVAAAVDRAEDKLTRVQDKLAKAEDKIAAEKTKLAKVASKVHVVSRAEAAPAAAPTPNQIVADRGFWPAAAATTGSPAQSADATGSVNPFASPYDAPSRALAYADQGASETPARAASVTAVPLPRIAAPSVLPAQTGESETTIAWKRTSDQPASAVLTVAHQKLATPLADPTRISDPWLRALLAVPNLTRSLSTTPSKARDVRTMAALMVKPKSSVVMTFSDDPNAGLTNDRFSGSAIMFMSTVTYPYSLRTAQLQ